RVILPILPLSLPEITTTVSPVFTCILSGTLLSLLDFVFILQYLWCQRYNLHKIAVSEFSGNRAKNTGSARVIIFIDKYSCIFIKFYIRSVRTTHPGF